MNQNMQLVSLMPTVHNWHGLKLFWKRDETVHLKVVTSTELSQMLQNVLNGEMKKLAMT